MLPYHPNSDALLPPPVLPPLAAEPFFAALVSDDDLVFVLTVFALFFLSLLPSVCCPVDFDGFDLACADDLVAFANTVFLGVGFGAAFGFAVAFGTGVSNGVGFGNSISLFA